MIERLLRKFSFVHELEAEIIRLRYAFESADRYASQVMAIKELRDATIAQQKEQLAAKDQEIVVLKGHLSGRLPQ
jgi:hypothetical protein